MKKTAVIYWSGTGNTESMAEAVAEGLRAAGAETELLTPEQVRTDGLAALDAVALGCPAMGSEVLEESEYQPMFDSCKALLAGKPTALFGSYGWGDGEWMREWAERVKKDGAVLVNDEGLIVNEAPDDAALADCKALGAKLIE